MDIYYEFATDEKAEIEGRWFPLSKTAEVLVARAGNERYLAGLRKRLESLDLANDAPESEAESAIIKTMAETILVGWKGLTFKGESLSYTTENAAKVLSIKDFRRRINGFADNFDAFKVKAEKELGND